MSMAKWQGRDRLHAGKYGRWIIGLATCAGVMSLGIVASCGLALAVNGDFLGITTGGQQDIAAARKAIEEGNIPDPDWITVEGFMSEHSIPVEPPADAGLLYATASTAWNGDFDVFTPLATVRIGFGSTVDAATFERDPLNVCLVVDGSGSMADDIDRRTSTSKLTAVKIAIDQMLAHLDDGDLVSVVSFNSGTKLWVEAVAGDDLASIRGAVDQIVADGGTDLARGIRRGYGAVNRHREAGRSDRVIVFTDAQLTHRNERRAIDFIDTMEEFADREIGATLFGVGTDFGQEIAFDISQVRGGNYFFLSDYDRIVSVFDEEFDFLVAPIAYDVKLDVSIALPFGTVEGVYGIPVDAPLPHELALEIPTLFLSSRAGGGAIMVRVAGGPLVDFDQENVVADIALSYKTPEGETRSQAPIQAIMPGGFDADTTINYFEDPSTERAVLLLNTALALRAASDDATRRSWPDDYRAPDYGQAEQRLTEFLEYFDQRADGMEDRIATTSRSLSEERSLLEQLLQNVGDRF